MKTRDGGGFVLVLVLLVLAALVAIAGEFARGVFVNISGLNNLSAMQRLSTASSSLLESTGGMLSEAIRRGILEPGAPPLEIQVEEDVSVSFELADENSKFNLNILVLENGELNAAACEDFKRLLRAVGMEESVADRVADWIDPDSLPMPRGLEEGAKNAPMESLPELALAAGEDAFNRLRPYVTVHGDGYVNINTASAPVLMSLSDKIGLETAERVITYRELQKFRSVGEFSKVVGEALATELTPKITVTASAYFVRVSAEQLGIRRVIEAATDAGGKVLYWREY